MAAAPHGSHRGRDYARDRELDLERSRRSKEYDHHRRHRSRDRGSNRRSDGGRSRGRELSDRYSRHRSPPRSRPLGRVEDREPGELSSGSGSEESRGPSLKARERGDYGVVERSYGGALSPSRKRKHLPVKDVNVSKMQATDSVRSRREVDTVAVELPQPSPPPLSDASTVATAGECSPMNFDMSVVSHEAEGLPDHESNKIMEGDEEYPIMRNIFTSRWVNAEEEEEVLVHQKKKSVSPGNSVEKISVKRAGPEPGELMGMSGGNSSISLNSMLVQGSESEDLEEDEGNCMDVAIERDTDSPAGYLLDTDVGSSARRSRIPEDVQPLKCINMLQSCRSIDEFDRLNTINEGTYGVVFRVRDKKTDEIVALKKVKIDKEREGEGFPLTALREINILLSLHHPSIVDVKEIVVGGPGDDTFMVMEYMEHDLKGVMEAMKQPYHQSEVKCLMLQLLEGVKYLHDNWILHRDLKTSNLLLNNRGELKICDFGLSRQYGSQLKPYTQPVVTLLYRAPELLLGTKEYSTAIDMWSLGCIMAELLMKKPLFNGKTEIDQLNEIFRMLGTPNDEIWPDYSKLPGAKAQFVKQPRNRLREKFPAVSFTGGLTLSESGFDLLNRLLTYDPEKRISADAALNHEWFREVPLPKTKDFMPTLPALNEQDRRFKKYTKTPDPLEKQLMKEQGSMRGRGLFG